jgi:FKBP-type peptidyl-prolyl cis-trans isomerase (trigger factor)
MATAVETLEKLERRVTLNVLMTDMDTEVEKRLKVRARTAKAPGFRPGSPCASLPPRRTILRAAKRSTPGVAAAAS